MSPFTKALNLENRTLFHFDLRRTKRGKLCAIPSGEIAGDYNTIKYCAGSFCRYRSRQRSDNLDLSIDGLHILSAPGEQKGES